MTCYDLRFPEMGRVLADAGTELALIPSSWTPGPRKEDHWRILNRARAIENTYFVAGVCQAPPVSTGGSILVDPLGIVVGEMGEKPGLIVREIDRTRVEEVRDTLPVLSNRRFDVVAK
jgi:deaminated glutathione amidase